ncbi:amidohydrolase family protein [Ewingella sp. S1.OA.A_B6]
MTPYKIALEEHFMDPNQHDYFQMLAQGKDILDMPGFAQNLAMARDVDAGRIADMDKMGIRLAILSYYNGAGVQRDDDVQRAVAKARQMNDFLAERTIAHPGRFGGWAALPVQDPKAAAAELRRCVTQFGFYGAMINGRTNGECLDMPKFMPIWETAAELGVPIYLHPGVEPIQPVGDYIDYPALSNIAWGWSVETGFHALRIMSSGLFDQFPDLQLVLGHMGELLPFHFGRFDQFAQSPSANAAIQKHSLSHYVRNNVLITTSGNLTPETLIGTMLAVGSDRILFATDYPIANAEQFNTMIEQAPISANDKQKIFHDNAARVFGL